MWDVWGIRKWSVMMSDFDEHRAAPAEDLDTHEDRSAATEVRKPDIGGRDPELRDAALGAGEAGMAGDQVAEARQSLVERLMRRRQALAEDIVNDVRTVIVDYSGLGELTISEDVQAAALATVTDLLESLMDRGTDTHDLDAIRRSASRRVHQEVSLPALLQSYRIWGAKLWQAVLDEAGTEPVNREAALSLVSRILDYVDRVSVSVAQVYLEEAAGAYRARDVVRSDVLESLLVGRALSDRARVDIARLQLGADTKVAVVLVRLSDAAPERIRTESLKALQACRETLATVSSSLLGVRDSDVICLSRVTKSSDLDSLVEGAHQVASRSAVWRVCVGRAHDGIEGIPRSFREAQEAATIAASRRRRRTAVLFSEVMVDSILVRSEFGDALLDDFVRPLLEYDKRHSSDLVGTLRAYVASDFNLTRTAQKLIINPNTVAYRIKRIGQLTGQDPTSSSGILTLALALRLLDG